MNTLYCLVGPSGTGKTTISTLLCQTCGCVAVDSYTTRPPRSKDEKGHIFVSEEEFRNLGEMIAWTRFNGYEYGVTKELLDRCNLYVIDPAGLRFLQEKYSEREIQVIVLHGSEKTLRARMAARGDSREKIDSRIQHDAEAFAGLSDIDGLHIDTDELTPEDVVSRIYDYMARPWTMFGDVNFLQYGGSAVRHAWTPSDILQHPLLGKDFEVLRLYDFSDDDKVLMYRKLVDLNDVEDLFYDEHLIDKLEEEFGVEFETDEERACALASHIGLEVGLDAAYNGAWYPLESDYIISREQAGEWLNRLGIRKGRA